MIHLERTINAARHVRLVAGLEPRFDFGKDEQVISSVQGIKLRLCEVARNVLVKEALYS